ncbi:MAG: PD40 domain-containing protein, partial [Candidatus Eremiobacteraeota bacterium]|nr:PD40 domain-containing protein [Candidatus Eremiobacteraeota bacterium]
MFQRTISLFACAWLLAAGELPQTIREDDFARLVSIDTPAIAPDGKDAAVVVTRIVWNDDKRTNDLVVVDLTTGAQQTIVAGAEDLSDPAFSPDGTKIAFLAQERAEKDPQTQLFVVPASGGAPAQLTHVKSGVDQFAWRPDGRAFAYASSDSDPTRTGAERFRDSFVFTTEPIVARALPQPARIFVVTLDDNATKQLTFGSQSVATGEAQSTLSWSPDATTIAFTLVPNAILNDQSYSRIALVDIASGAVRTPTGATAWESDPIFSPDGRYVAYTCAKGDQQVNRADLC